MISVGDRIPDISLTAICDGKSTPVTTKDLFAGKKIVLSAAPGAFTPTCSARHLPGYVDTMATFRDKGVEVFFLSVNDAFVMSAWGKSVNAPEDLTLLADGNGSFTQAIGLELDASGFGMGTRSQRYALIANDGIVEALFVEAGGEFKVSAAEEVLSHL